jgi:hypothetical protein
MARQRGARFTMVAAAESTYGTAPASGFRAYPVATQDLDAAQALLRNELLGFGRDPLAPELDAVNADGDIVVPVDLNNFGFWLRQTFGAPVTTGSGPYTHTFTSGAWSLPSAAIEMQMPDVPDFNMVTGAVVNQMSIPLTRQGHIQATMGMMARNAVKATSTAAGSLSTAHPLLRFLQRHGTLSRDGSALANIVSATLTYMNKLDRIETIGDGGLIAGLDPSDAELTLSMVARYADTTLLDQALAGTPQDFVYALDRGANQSLTFTIPNLYLPRPKKTVPGPQGVQVTFEGVAAQNSASGGMITAVLVNSIASYA